MAKTGLVLERGVIFEGLQNAKPNWCLAFLGPSKRGSRRIACVMTRDRDVTSGDLVFYMVLLWNVVTSLCF